jgi:hypothetical protein
LFWGGFMPKERMPNKKVIYPTNLWYKPKIAKALVLF